MDQRTKTERRSARARGFGVTEDEDVLAIVVGFESRLAAERPGRRLKVLPSSLLIMPDWYMRLILEKKGGK